MLVEPDAAGQTRSNRAFFCAITRVPSPLAANRLLVCIGLTLVQMGRRHLACWTTQRNNTPAVEATAAIGVSGHPGASVGGNLRAGSSCTQSAPRQWPMTALRPPAWVEALVAGSGRGYWSNLSADVLVWPAAGVAAEAQYLQLLTGIVRRLLDRKSIEMRIQTLRDRRGFAASRSHVHGQYGSPAHQDRLQQTRSRHYSAAIHG